jgi:hypothetical protein
MNSNLCFRNPSRVVRSLLVAAVFAMPGSIVGLILAVFLPFRVPLIAAGIIAGAVAGILIESK